MEKFNNARRGVALAAALLATASCAAPASEGAPAPEASVAATAAAAETRVETAPAVTTEINGIPIKGPAQNVNGKYLQTTLKADDPIFNLDMNLVTGDNVAAFTEDELKEAVRVASIFTAEEGIDSFLNGSNDNGDVGGWWAMNRDKFTSTLQEQGYQYLAANNSLVVRGAWDRDNAGNRQYWYDGNSTRIQIRENKISKIEVFSQWPNSVGVTTDLNYIIWGKNEAGEKYPINVKGHYYLNLKKDATTGGQWLIDGQNSEYTGYKKN
ncbi:hypothetical protein [Pseudarthrobacter sulfonivorans]|uniref:hypothetical protein n=1 Tax=Pseudarthrobacter sulfonivorans TaxID=121292 RepID=UPI002782AF82|nr:hypothetical protein [Pseudarthrobacter sulfonivorans]MDP9998410.1 hypothetical protein [Pseudarthrobacter sulfonivorans]